MAFESSDASLVSIERSVWSDRGVGVAYFFSRVLRAVAKSFFAALNALIAGSRLL